MGYLHPDLHKILIIRVLTGLDLQQKLTENFNRILSTKSTVGSTWLVLSSRRYTGKLTVAVSCREEAICVMNGHRRKYGKRKQEEGKGGKRGRTITMFGMD